MDPDLNWAKILDPDPNSTKLTLHAHAARHGAAGLHLFHHALNALHAADGPEHVRVHGLGHALVHLPHLGRIQVLDLLLILEELLHAAHLLHHLHIFPC